MMIQRTHSEFCHVREAQIPPHTKRSALPAWNAFLRLSRGLARNRIAYVQKNNNTVNIEGVWLVLEAIASVWELMLCWSIRPTIIYLLIIEAADKDDTHDEQSNIAMRPLGVRTTLDDGLPLERVRVLPVHLLRQQ
jgi:hypothetical protein